MDVREQAITPDHIGQWRNEYKDSKEKAAGIRERLLSALQPEVKVSAPPQKNNYQFFDSAYFE